MEDMLLALDRLALNRYAQPLTVIRRSRL